MLKVGLLLNSLQIQAWEYELIRQIHHSDLAQIELIVLNASPKTGSYAPWFYRIYRKLDRILFTIKPDAFEKKTLDFFFDEVEWHKVKPLQTKFDDRFRDEDTQKIEDLGLDVLIRLGFRILKGGILKAAKLGIWSFHHGDPGFYRGGPPAFWEVMQSKSVTGLVLMQLSEQLDQGKVLYQSFSQTAPLSVQRNANAVFWKSAYIIPRVLKEVDTIGVAVWLEKIAQKQVPIKSLLLKPPAGFQMAKILIKLVARNAKRKLNEGWKKAHWQVGFVKRSDWSLENGFKWQDLTLINHPNPKNSYWADPFPLALGEEEGILVEEFDQKEKIGTIILIDQKGRNKSILKEAWHLSYPYVLEVLGKTYLIPESAETKKVYRYPINPITGKFGEREFFFPNEAFDPTVWKNERGYWLFVNQKIHPSISPFDELFLYHSDSWENPKWLAHPQNPIVSDVHKSRPAGKLFVSKGKLYRPAQDSGLRYGHRIQVMEIVQMDQQCYQEKLAYILDPPEKDGILGMHTLNFSQDKVYLDFYSRR